MSNSKSSQRESEGLSAPPNRVHGTSTLGSLLFITLRSLDVPFQLYLLRRYPLTTSGSSYLGLSPYYATVASMVVVTSIRHVFWKLVIGEQVLAPSFAMIVSTFNTVFNGLNITMAIWGRIRNAPSANEGTFNSASQTLGLGLFIIGSFLETFSELQRKTFKSSPKNKGKLYTGGLFSLAQHINFGSYLLWRVGFSMFCGGWTWGAMELGYFSWYFSSIGVPDIDKYLAERYGNAWREYERETKYSILPWVY
ncbi:uncharacterized protein PAC_16594 [Phialocephala subalpina]|uniref:Uncharacterized protein n=1 Tax=Phialocephala subalpina TaxID=576137 RepID=A0A1L7XNT6_9HELO|nr:uncharacterized protein PAC_16594 [Phialocephala subalpina]